MSVSYDRYIEQHRNNVVAAFDWLKTNLPDTIDSASEYLVSFHDGSKFTQGEYDAYDAYFYGGNRSFSVVNRFREAWLHHIHNNPHHWQHWVLINDDPEEGTVALDMPYEYIVEMICDWWSFSHKTGNLYEIFDWYDKHKSTMILSDATRKHVEKILSDIKTKLDSIN